MEQLESKPQAPKWIVSFFRWFCNPELAEVLEGDLVEQFNREVATRGVRRARILFVLQVFRFFHPAFIRRKINSNSHPYLISIGMFKNYLKITYRSILKQKQQSIINISGLSLGLAASLFIIFHIQQELSYESSFANYQDTYRISTTKWAKSNPALKEAFDTNFGNKIHSVGRFALFGNRENVMIYNNKHTPIPNGYYADPSIIDIFGFEVLRGNSDVFLDDPYSIVITESTANKLFGDEDPLNKEIRFTTQGYNITGVIKDIPANSHLKINYLVSMETFADMRGENIMNNTRWMVMYTYTWIDEKNVSDIKSRLADFQMKYYNNERTEEEIETGVGWFELDPISKIHLEYDKEQEMRAGGDITYIYIFMALAGLIILIACTNFVNIYTTQALKRLKELGVRKVIGAKKLQLSVQFLTETFFLTIIAGVFALIICILAIPSYNEIARIPIEIVDFLSSGNILIASSLVIIVALLSGLYPALVMARIQPIIAFKGADSPGSKHARLRKFLIVFQFAIALFMITSTIVIHQQLQFFKNTNLGFDKDHIVAVRLYGPLYEKVIGNEALKTELKRSPNIENIGFTSALLGDIWSVEGLEVLGQEEENDDAWQRFARVDDGFIPTLNLQFIDGRNFVAESDTLGAFVINQAAAKNLNLSEPVGTLVRHYGDEGTIVGVVEDFNYNSLHSAVEPLVLKYQPQAAGIMTVKLKGQNTKEAISYIEDMISDLVPGAVVRYKFLDDELGKLYKSEEDMTSVFQVFAILALVISTMGLYGLASYTVELRTKEIGIRKSLGASITGILGLLLNSYTRLIIVAMVLGIPLAYYFLNKWLANFEYRIEVQWYVSAIAAMAVIIVGILAILGQSFQAARANPVDSLRSE